LNVISVINFLPLLYTLIPMFMWHHTGLHVIPQPYIKHSLRFVKARAVTVLQTAGHAPLVRRNVPQY